MVDYEGRAPGEGEHVEELNGRPFPTVSFAADYCHGRGALHGEGEEDHQGQCAAKGHVVVKSGLQVHGLGCRVSAVESAHGRNHYLAGQDAGEQADADLPVEAKWGNSRLDEVAEASDEAVCQLGGGVRAAGRMNDGDVCEHPQGQRYGEDDGASLADEDAAAVDETLVRERRVGMRYWGSSRMNGVSLDLRMELFRIQAVVIAPTKPAR